MPLARRRCVSCVAIGAYVLSGLSIVLVNKMIVHDIGLHTPCLVSSTGALFTAAFTRMLVLMGRVNVRPVGVHAAQFAFCRALPVGVLAAGSLCFGNMSYIYLDAGFVQMLKAGTPALLMFVLCALKVEQVSPSTAMLALFMVLGSLLATMQQPNATILGLTVQFTSQMCEVLQCTAMQVFLQKLGFEAWDAGYYLSPAVAACCLLPSLVLEWPHVIAARKVGLLFSSVPLLILSGMIGIVVNFSAMLVIKFTSSLLAKLLVIARSSALVLWFVLNGESCTVLQVVGYVTTICAFGGYSVVKAREIEQQALAEARAAAEESSHETEPKDSDDDLQQLDLDARSPTNSVGQGESGSSWDLTSSMFWFAICVVLAGAYQAAVVGDLPSPCLFYQRELSTARHHAMSSSGMPPTPYLEPITAGTEAHDFDMDDEGGADGKKHGEKFHTIGALSVESNAKVLYLSDGRFLLHSDLNGGVTFNRRTPEKVLSSSWFISSKAFGTVYLSALSNRGQVSWLSCKLTLVPEWTEACLLWMTAAAWDTWSSDGNVGEYVFRRHGDQYNFVTVVGDNIEWSTHGTAFHVSNWVPEACPLRGMAKGERTYPDAHGEVTFTMTTFFHVYARSIMFRQALASVFTHVKDRDTFVKEFLVINDWYEGPSLDFRTGNFSGPDVHSTRQEMLTFFPGCKGLTTFAAAQRPAGQKCTFIFKDASERGQQKALNILLDLMTTKFWIHFEDDHVFYQDVYISRFLAPMYDHPNGCWQRKQASVQQLPQEPGGGGAQKRRLLAQPPRGPSPEDCIMVASVLFGGHRGADGLGSDDTWDVMDYKFPHVLLDNEYVKELLKHGGFDDYKNTNGWGRYEAVGAVRWPLFSLRPSLHNLTYIKSLEAPIFYGGRKGRFSENRDITVWKDHGTTYHFNWDFELEFAVRWARAGGTVATLSPGACMRDVSNGISSFEKSFEYS